MLTRAFTLQSPTCMNRQLLVVLGLMLGLMGCGGDGESEIDAPSDVDTAPDAPAATSLIGSWLVVTFDGNPSPDTITWTFAASAVTVAGSGASFSGTYTTNPTATPQQIEISLDGAQPNPNAAIYRLDTASTLTLKVQNGATVRATTFTVEIGYDLLELTKQ